jgi:predicted outer membrane repeat protein
MRLSILAVFLFIYPATLFAATIHVPADQPTIQAAIDVANGGDEIHIAAGTYTGEGNKNLDPNGKALTIVGVAGSTQTFLDCQGSGRAFDLTDPNSAVLTIEGLTIFQANPGGGYPEGNGGAIRCDNVLLHLRDCIFQNNVAGYHGGAIWADNASQLTIENCSFIDNSAPSGPHAATGAVHIQYNCVVVISDSEFIGNQAHENAGALNVTYTSSLNISNTTFYNNTAVTGFAGAINSSGQTYATNLTVVGNSAGNGVGGGIVVGGSWILENSIIAFSTSGDGVHCWDGESVDISCTNIIGNEGGDWIGEISDQLGISGNISLDPLFCDPDMGDFTLRNDSPCAPDNNDCGVLMGAWPVGCSTSPESATWSEVKALY